jgi:hypothetical protein
MVNTTMKEQLLNNLRLQKEIVLSQKDPIYFMENYIHCSHPTHGTMLFAPHPYQEEYINALAADNSDYLVSAARQTGSSLSSTMFMFWQAFFNKFETISFTSQNQHHSCDNLQKIRHAYRCMPAWLRDFNPLVVDNKGYMEFANGSRIIVHSSNPCSYRGHATTAAFIDNIQLIRSQDDVSEILHTFKMTGVRIIAVAPGGGNELFNDLYNDAEARKGSYIPFRLVADNYGIGLL